jgi:hypothetical protein
MKSNRLAIGAALATAAFAAVIPAAIEARGDIALSQAAADLGYTYAYLGPEDAVSLGRPGVTILIRPGERLFDVNDRTEAMDGAVPRFSRNDLYVSEQFVARLRAIAARYSGPTASGRSVVIAAPSVRTPFVTGPIASLDVRQIPGSQEVDVSGKAPAPNLPITLTLVGTFSSDVPDTVLSRRQVLTGPDGRFHANVSVAPGFFRGAYLTLVASSVPGVASASLRFEVKAPNGAISVPAEQTPRSIQ